MDVRHRPQNSTRLTSPVAFIPNMPQSRRVSSTNRVNRAPLGVIPLWPSNTAQETLTGQRGRYEVDSSIRRNKHNANQPK